MQEIDAVVGQIVPAIGAAVSAYGAGVLSRVEDKAAGETVRLGQRVLTRILHRSREADRVRGAVTDLTHDQEDPDALAALRLQLRRALADDPDLVSELSAMLPRGPVAHDVGPRGVVIGGNSSGIVSTGDDAINIQHP